MNEPRPGNDVALGSRTTRRMVVPAQLERVGLKLAAPCDPRVVLLRKEAVLSASGYRALRHRIAERGDRRVLLVSSAREGEGKSTCAVNLALALAESGRNRVLLAEVNTQRPALAEILGIAPPACMLEQLHQHRLEPAKPWVVGEVAAQNLDLLLIRPRPEADAEPYPRINGPTLMIAMERLRAVYDFIVIDTSSILSGLDVPLLEDAAEGIIITARTRRSRARDTKSALALLEQSKVVGIVMLDL